jgi:hypothetical protein
MFVSFRDGIKSMAAALEGSRVTVTGIDYGRRFLLAFEKVTRAQNVINKRRSA